MSSRMFWIPLTFFRDPRVTPASYSYRLIQVSNQ